jgi:hypothetical protein
MLDIEQPDRVHVQPATRLPACSRVGVSGISQVPRRSSHAFASFQDPSRITHVAMEATGVYWKPVWHILDDGEFKWCWQTPRM